MSTLREMRGTQGACRRKLRGQASKQRKCMINRSHAEDDQRLKIDVKEYEKEMPEKFRALYEQVKGCAEGKKALSRFKKFWGIMPTDIRIVEMPGPKSKTKYLVGMGNAGTGGKIQKKGGGTIRAKGAKLVATDASGKRIFLLSGRNSSASKAKLREVGVAEETHYVPTPDQEAAGTFKKNKYWVHRHDDEGGEFPTVYKDQAGNYIYAPGTYSVTDWIRK